MGHGYIIVVVEYFTKWDEVMPTYKNNSEKNGLFLLNHVIFRFSVPQAIITDPGKHFLNYMMFEITAKLGLQHKISTPYYPQANGK